ncbi:ATPase, T2SS/T4P/T4SS family [Pseudobdellovibrio exovorus]|uniref:Flp pilus assembly protein, ATPase n=1 Tax=Pseudobdellovibrio exovorus JSS TaxID=1184267 RepID=M4V9Y4_9BACT|nr:ATPase, T2SS/T4P/T4SS family [Pseudobdellovibrio exovorus]AGH94841.1 Flp pilus assembly protein, ATPase [Pseudobdellovibrio exovorus JSS]
MHPEIKDKIQQIFFKQKNDLRYDWADDFKKSAPQQFPRIYNELNDLGPLNQLLADGSITEILVNSPHEIFYERNSRLFQHDDHFFSVQTYNAALERLAHRCGTYLNRDKPFVEGNYKNIRVTIVFNEVSRGFHLLSLRIQPSLPWTLTSLAKNQWCTEQQVTQIRQTLSHRHNFLVIGPTGSGKTSFMQALLNEFKPNLQRLVVIEDTQELHLPNAVSVSLLTREDPSGLVSNVNMDHLLKRALRLRADRLVVGEIRSDEARTLLMTLATGHAGSFGSLHASTAAEALLRLEMLIQMGAPQWSLSSIRRLIQLCVHSLFVVENQNGKRRLEGQYQISSLEEHGFTLSRLE